MRLDVFKKKSKFYVFFLIYGIQPNYCTVHLGFWEGVGVVDRESD